MIKKDIYNLHMGNNPTPEPKYKTYYSDNQIYSNGD